MNLIYATAKQTAVSTIEMVIWDQTEIRLWVSVNGVVNRKLPASVLNNCSICEADLAAGIKVTIIDSLNKKIGDMRTMLIAV